MTFDEKHLLEQTRIKKSEISLEEEKSGITLAMPDKEPVSIFKKKGKGALNS